MRKLMVALVVCLALVALAAGPVTEQRVWESKKIAPTKADTVRLYIGITTGEFAFSGFLNVTGTGGTDSCYVDLTYRYKSGDSLCIPESDTGVIKRFRASKDTSFTVTWSPPITDSVAAIITNTNAGGDTTRCTVKLKYRLE